MKRLLVYQESQGIGDLITAACAVAGLVHSNKDSRVTFAAPQGLLPWTALFGDAHERIGLKKVDKSSFDSVYEPYSTYDLIEVPAHGAHGRHFLYARACGVEPRIPTISISSRNADHAESMVRKKARPVIALAPLATSGNRCWPIHHWLDLEDMIRSMGMETMILADPRDRVLRQIMKGSISQAGPRQTAALLRQCAGLVANDSGMPHLAGVLGIPALVLCGPTKGKSVFGFYECVEVLQSSAPCSPCYWDECLGYRRACDQTCEALWALSPAQVMAWVSRVA